MRIGATREIVEGVGARFLLPGDGVVAERAPRSAGWGGNGLRDLPDVAGGVGERGRALAARSVHRSVQQRHPAGGQLRARGVRVVYPDREAESSSSYETGRSKPFDQ
jgi:hypothetical protein